MHDRLVAVTGKDQLQQSRADGERASRAQAVMVSAWAESRRDTKKVVWEVHILNRSPDPLPHIDVGFDGDVYLKGENRGLSESAFFRVYIDSLAPCTELIYSKRNLALSWTLELGNEKTRMRDDGDAYVWPGIGDASFIDRDGRKWRRLDTGRWTTFL